ncbi:hypothetical protein H6F88_17535 [Oculatella sp. FACHB-28]|uniref:hypothetical protein n=1 Tax=Oculatella sp. FACHB-28 TaxID=2692845 RepID=UPI001685D8F1|nr:hypothetical protein [Oculatella sp. FACHB-28]MBD2057800.1 hypothetical protein [Oculatella sp. FACHB-28]
MSEILGQVVSQLIALITFFAFPAIQYILLKRLSQREGYPKLGYIPGYGFRLVIKNIERKRRFRDIKYKIFIRKLIPPSDGSTVYTFSDQEILSGEELFLFPNSDQTMLCFQLKGRSEDNVTLVLTDKIGKPIQDAISIESFDKIICDYSAAIQNFLNFDIQIEKRVVIESKSLMKFWKETNLPSDKFKSFDLDYVLDAS